MKEIKVFAPATVANVGPGFDIFGFALENIGDTLRLSHKEQPGLSITKGRHCENIPADPNENVAGVAIRELLHDARVTDVGLQLHIEKNIIPGSGLGSSASSASGAVYAVNKLLSLGYERHELIKFAMLGEGAGGGIPHADNVAPCLLGGFTIVRSYEPLDVIKLPETPALWVAVVHPIIEVKTSSSKRMLKKEISMQTAVQQWGNVAGLITGILTSDYALIGRSMEDFVAEPVRSMMIPGYDIIRAKLKDTSAIGASISGSGPSIFAFCSSKESATEVTGLFGEVYCKLDIEHNLYVSRINSEGVVHEVH